MALLLALLAVTNLASAQQPISYVQVPPPVPNPNASNLSRGPDGSKDFHRTVVLYPAPDVAAPTGTIFRSVGFLIRTPAATAATGTLRLWLRPTNDLAYSLAPDWAYLLQQPEPFQLLYDGPLTIPAVAGWYYLPLRVPYTHTGRGFYLAYEWVATTKSAVSPTYDTNNSRDQTLFTETGIVAPTQLTQTSSHRPVVRLGFDTPAQDAEVLRIYAAGQLARQAGILPHTVRAVVRNVGQQPLRNLPVTLSVSGTGGYTVTTTLPSLAPGAEATVQLPGWAPTSLGLARLRVSLPPDDQPANNVRLDSVQVADRLVGYGTGNPPAPLPTFSAIGFDKGSGTLLCRMPLHGPVEVSAVRARMSYLTGQGSTVFGIVLDAQGRLLARSPNHALLDTERDQWLSFPLPAPVQVTGTAFYYGLAQLPTTNPRGYFPLATQPELLPRDSAYYSVVGDSALTGLKPPRELRTLGRLLLAAEVVSRPLNTTTAKQARLSVYPNPCLDGWLHIPGLLAVSRWEVLDMVGRRRCSGVLEYTRGARAAVLDLRDLPLGSYIIRLQQPTGTTIAKFIRQ